METMNRKNTKQKGKVTGLENESRKDREWIQLSIGLFLVYLYFLIRVIIDKKYSEGYYNSHFLLLVIILMIYSAALLRKGGAKLLFDSFKKFTKTPKLLSKKDIGILIFLTLNILATLSLLIIDFSFLGYRSYRGPAIFLVVVSLISGIMSYFRK
jgi:hypothetical protein